MRRWPKMQTRSVMFSKSSLTLQFFSDICRTYLVIYWKQRYSHSLKCRGVPFAAFSRNSCFRYLHPICPISRYRDLYGFYTPRVLISLSFRNSTLRLGSSRYFPPTLPSAIHWQTKPRPRSSLYAVSKLSFAHNSSPLRYKVGVARV